MMKMLSFLFLLSVTLLACTQQPTASATDSSATVESDTIPFDSLTVLQGDSIVKEFYQYRGKLVSDIAVKYEENVDGTWSFVYTFENGIMQRLDVYGINGYQHRFVEMREGYQYHTVMFHRNGNRYLEEFYDKNNEPIGTKRRWDETGKLVMEKNYE